MLIKRFSVVAILVLSSFSSGIHAQDILSSTGKTVRSYNYLEGLYTLNLEDKLPNNAKVEAPVLIRLSLDVRDKITVVGQYIDQTSEQTVGGLVLDVEVIAYKLSLRYRGELTQIQNTDWIAGVMAGLTSVDVTDNTQRFTETSNFQGFYLGGRHTLTDRLEIGAGVELLRLQAGGSFSGTGEATLVYRVTDKLDIALGGSSLTDDNLYGIGLRYTWY